MAVSFGAYPGAPPRDEAARRADLIVDAIVSASGVPFWKTPDGKRPTGTNREVLAQGDFIFTPVNFNVKRVLKGVESARDDLSINRLGGQVGEDSFDNEDGGYFHEGDRIILFLKDCSDQRSESRVARGFRYEFVQRYLIDADGMASGVIDGPPFPVAELLQIIEEEHGNAPFSPTNC